MGRVNKQEWESKCNKCGRCCYSLLPNGTRQDTIHCKFFDPATKLCSVYERRFEFATNCREIIPINIEEYRKGFLPKECEYLKGDN